MTLFTDLEPERPQRRSFAWVGWTLLLAALFGLVVIAFLPAPYVFEKPGPVFDTLGDVSVGGEQVPLIDIQGEPVFPTAGTLDMLTVTIAGDPDNLPSWLEVAVACDVKRRHGHLRAGEGREQLPVAVDVAIPVEAAAEA